MNEYYTYAYLREDRTPYYVGRGKGARYKQKHRNVKVPPEDRILFLKKNLTFSESVRHEIYMIAVLGRKDLGTGILRNMTEGGEGRLGPKSPEECEKISRALTGRPLSEEHRLKISSNMRGKTHSQETRDLMSKQRAGNNYASAARGYKWWNNGEKQTKAKVCPGPDWTAGRLPESGYFKSHSEESRQKMSQTRKGKPWTEARRAAQRSK